PPLRVVLQIAALLAAALTVREQLDVAVRVPDGAGAQMLALLAVAALAAVINNLPAAAIVAVHLDGAHPAVSMLGLAIGGALTVHGSVATALVFDRTSPETSRRVAAGYLRLVSLPALF